jgi:periplasmic protein TonB
MSARVVRDKMEEVKVTFVKQAPPAPKAAPPKVRPKVKTEPNAPPPMVLQQAIIAPREIPTEKPKESDLVNTSTFGNGDGGEGGDVANVAGGIRGPIIDAADVVSTPIPFREEVMTRPEYLSGPNPEYTAKALENEVQGLMIVRCVVNSTGEVRDCRVVKSLPFMDRAVIRALEARRYKPARLEGKIITVDYEFRINLVLPE